MDKGGLLHHVVLNPCHGFQSLIPLIIFALLNSAKGKVFFYLIFLMSFVLLPEATPSNPILNLNRHYAQ